MLPTVIAEKPCALATAAMIVLLFSLTLMGPPTLNGSLKFIYRITAKICVCSYFLVRFALVCSAFNTLTNEGPALTISSINCIAGRYA